MCVRLLGRRVVHLIEFGGRREAHPYAPRLIHRGQRRQRLQSQPAAVLNRASILICPGVAVVIDELRNTEEWAWGGARGGAQVVSVAGNGSKGN